MWRSLWSLSTAKAMMGEYLMGHSIDPLEYDKSWREVQAYMEEYRRVAPWLNAYPRTRMLCPVRNTRTFSADSG